MGLLLIACTIVGCTTSSEVGRFGADDGGAGAAGAAGAAGNEGGVQLEPVHTRFALGVGSTCGINSSGAVVCWGDNTVGQLGTGSELPEMSSTPVSVTGLGSGARAIFGGAVAHCAVLNDGHATCWGDSVFGVFEGFGAVHAISYFPLEAPGLSSVVLMAIGTYFHCALNTFGGVKCYGLNGTGQLGIGSLDDAFTPVDVQGLPECKHLSASQSGFFACAATVAGAAYCWGSNTHGQLGIGSTEDAFSAVQVSGLSSGVSAVAAGREHACAIVNGAVHCWGDNSIGQLGGGASAGGGQLVPFEVPGLPPIQAIAAGVQHTCALTDSGAVYCWGSTYSDSSPTGPKLIVASGVSVIAAGGDHSCALMTDGVLRCWGEGSRGQLGPFTGAGAPL